uniref:Uncharacterized protein n=1 Tax=Periophthalmus magnuspinnatus TaxID=409849 RepID=A0A3B4BM26_9GOBI
MLKYDDFLLLVLSALRTLLPLTSKRAILMSGHSPVHAAADGGQPQCLQLLIDNGFDVNVLLNYGDLRRSPLYFAVCNGDITCAQMLLEAGARSDLDPLRCILVAIRAERYELVRLLLTYGADVNCYFNAISHTVFPTGLQYCLRDPLMLRLLLNGGYDDKGGCLQAGEHHPNCEIRGWQHHVVGLFCCRRDWWTSQNRCIMRKEHYVEILKQHLKTSARKLKLGLKWGVPNRQ